MSTTNHATVRLVSGMHFKGVNRRGMGVDMDSRPAGEPMAGASPIDLVLQIAGGCTAMDVISVLRKRKLEIEQLEVELEGIRREEHPKVFEEIKMIYRAKGEGITVDELERAADLSFNRYCSVLNMLKGTVKISFRCEVLD